MPIVSYVKSSDTLQISLIKCFGILLKIYTSLSADRDTLSFDTLCSGTILLWESNPLPIVSYVKSTDTLQRSCMKCFCDITEIYTSLVADRDTLSFDTLCSGTILLWELSPLPIVPYVKISDALSRS